MSDFMIPLPASIEAPDAMPIEEAIDIVCEKLGLPQLGGPSGKGWSLYSTAQRCAHLFNVQHVQPRPTHGELRAPAVPLQVGALYHFLQALYYAPGLGEAAYRNRGLISGELLRGARGRHPKLIEIPPDAADTALKMLREMADPLEGGLQASVNGGAMVRRPSAAIVYAAEQAFDAHTAYYGDGREDMTPLAIEWWAENEALEYTCRYDGIFRLGENDPLGLPAGSTWILERKTSAWLSEMATTGWFLDGEILGEILNWQPSGCEQLFGPLGGVIVDIVTKAKTPQFLRVVVPVTTPAVAAHGKWIRYGRGQMHIWAATGIYPQSFTQCFDRWGKCSLWEKCAIGDTK